MNEAGYEKKKKTEAGMRLGEVVLARDQYEMSSFFFSLSLSGEETISKNQKRMGRWDKKKTKLERLSLPTRRLLQFVQNWD